MLLLVTEERVLDRLSGFLYVLRLELERTELLSLTDCLRRSLDFISSLFPLTELRTDPDLLERLFLIRSRLTLGLRSLLEVLTSLAFITVPVFLSMTPLGLDFTDPPLRDP